MITRVCLLFYSLSTSPIFVKFHLAQIFSVSLLRSRLKFKVICFVYICYGDENFKQVHTRSMSSYLVGRIIALAAFGLSPIKPYCCVTNSDRKYCDPSCLFVGLFVGWFVY